MKSKQPRDPIRAIIQELLLHCYTFPFSFLYHHGEPCSPACYSAHITFPGCCPNAFDCSDDVSCRVREINRPMTKQHTKAEQQTRENMSSQMKTKLTVGCRDALISPVPCPSSLLSTVQDASSCHLLPTKYTILPSPSFFAATSDLQSLLLMVSLAGTSERIHNSCTREQWRFVDVSFLRRSTRRDLEYASKLVKLPSVLILR
jgi:hypothetical protein